MSKRPIIATLAYWGVVGLAQLFLAVSCGFGAGWDEASSIAISDCRYEAGMWMQALNFVSIFIYSVAAIWAIRSLKRGD